MEIFLDFALEQCRRGVRPGLVVFGFTLLVDPLPPPHRYAIRMWASYYFIAAPRCEKFVVQVDCYYTILGTRRFKK
jgi:hypothetical protein